VVKKIKADAVEISSDAVKAWEEMIGRVAGVAVPLGIRPKDISDEEFWLKDDEQSLEVRCRMGRINVSMDIPAGEWRWNTKRN